MEKEFVLVLKFMILFSVPDPLIRRISSSEIFRPQPYWNPFGMVVGPACQTPLLFFGKKSLVVGD